VATFISLPVVFRHGLSSCWRKGRDLVFVIVGIMHGLSPERASSAGRSGTMELDASSYCGIERSLFGRHPVDPRERFPGEALGPALWGFDLALLSHLAPATASG
jgi:hypothetical protein